MFVFKNILPSVTERRERGVTRDGMKEKTRYSIQHEWGENQVTSVNSYVALS